MKLPDVKAAELDELLDGIADDVNRAQKLEDPLDAVLAEIRFS